VGGSVRSKLRHYKGTKSKRQIPRFARNDNKKNGAAISCRSGKSTVRDDFVM